MSSIDQLLNDQFLQILQQDDFNSQQFASELIAKTDIDLLVEKYFDFQNKNKKIEKILEDFALQNQDTLKKQFIVPENYGSSFDQIKNIALQSKRKVIQTKEILQFNSEEIKNLLKEIKELSCLNKELSDLDKLNESILDFSAFIKKELYLQGSLILKKIKENLQKINFDNQKLVNKEYFQKLVQKKETEFYFIVKDQIFSKIFEFFVLNYDQDFYVIFQQQDDVQVAFDTSQEKFKYFTSQIQNHCNMKIQKQNLISIEDFNAEIPKIKDMIDLFFDQRVYDFLKNEIRNQYQNTFVDDMKFIELVIAAQETEILPQLCNDLIDSFKFKFTQIFISFLQFLLYSLESDDCDMKINLKEKTKNFADYNILSELQDIPFFDLFQNLLMKIIIILWQKIAIIIKEIPQITDQDFNKLFQTFFQTLQSLLENLFFNKELITFYNKNIYEYCQKLKQKFDINHTHCFMLINKLSVHFIHLKDQLTQFIGKISKRNMIQIHINNFQDGLFLKFKIKLRSGFTKIENGKFQFEKIEIPEEEIKQKNYFQKRQSLKLVFDQLDNTKSEITQEKKINGLILIEEIKKYLWDLLFFMESNVSENRFIHNQFIQYLNQTQKFLFEEIQQVIQSQEKYTKIINLQQNPYFQRNLKKIKKFLFETQQITFEQVQLESYLSNESKFDYSKMKEIQSFNSEIRDFKFQEQCFILLRSFRIINQKILSTVIQTWKQLDQDTLNRISVSMDCPLELQDSMADLIRIKKGIKGQKKEQGLLKKLQAGMDLSYYENIILMIYYFFQQRNFIIDLVFFLKINFDFLIYSFFENSTEDIKNLTNEEKKFYNISGQIFEFKKLMSGYNEIAKLYIDDKVCQIFVINSLDMFFKRLHQFIFENKPIFINDGKTLKNYYIEFCKILSQMEIMSNYQSEIFEQSENYRLMKKLIFAQDEEEIQDIGMFYNLEDKAFEINLAKESILFENKQDSQ